MTVTTTLDLSRIYRNPVFQSRSAVESHKELSRALTEHQLRWGRGDVATSLHRHQLNRISMMILHYGAEVEVQPDPFKDFVLVQMPLRGTTEIECDGICLKVESNEIAVIAPRQHIRLLWHPDCEQLIIKLPYGLLKQIACHTCEQAHCPTSPVECTMWKDAAFKINPQLASQWHALVQQLLSLLPSDNSHGDNPTFSPPPHSLHPAWLNHFEQTAALFLQAHQPSMLEPDTRGEGLPPMHSASDSAAKAKLTRLEDYIRQRLYAPISLADLACAAGVSPRTLNQLCQRYYGVAPMILLRHIRLETARSKLLSNPGSSVTDVALEFGFGHLGRFSAYYRERFGELPRDTIPRRHGPCLQKHQQVREADRPLQISASPYL